ncbi:MAG: hypothetical protein RLZZ352_1849 [Pseudomonadota bacterium]|jgi:hypothetical protein
MHRTHSAPWPRRLALSIVLLALAGCSLFVSHYDAAAYQQFTNLKAFHLKFLDDYREAQGRLFDEAKIRNTCDAGKLKFLEAKEYAQGKKDDTRVAAIQYLHNAFTKDCELGSRKLFGAVYVQEQTGQLTVNYDLAIQGELSRVGAPTK